MTITITLHATGSISGPDLPLYGPVRYRVDQRQDGTELLLLHDAAVLGRVVENRDRDEIAGYVGRLAADKPAKPLHHAAMQHANAKKSAAMQGDAMKPDAMQGDAMQPDAMKPAAAKKPMKKPH